MTTQKIDFENSSGNVFADLGLEDANELYTRAALGAQVVTIIKDEGYTQAETSKLLGIKQSEVSALMCARFHRFSQERLIGFLNNAHHS
jgi:predicted XRE-type DNA-binding protein